MLFLASSITLFTLGYGAFLKWVFHVTKDELNPKFWTKLPEGALLPIEKGGRIIKVMGAPPGFAFDQDWNLRSLDELKKLEDDNPEERKKIKLRREKITVFGKLFGFHWMGVYPITHRYIYDFEWDEWRKGPPPESVAPNNKSQKGKPVATEEKKTGSENKPTEFHIVTRQEETSRFLFRAAYPVFVAGAETEDGFQIDAKILVTFQAWNVITALRLKNWYSNASAQIHSAVTDFVRTKKLGDLVKLQTENSEEASHFVQKLVDLNVKSIGDTNIGLRDLTGVLIIAANFMEFELVGSQEEKAAMSKVKLTTIEARAKIKEAKGYAKTLEIKSSADAAAIKLLANARGEEYRMIASVPGGLSIRHSEAIEKTKLSALAIVLDGDKSPHQHVVPVSTVPDKK